jgi:hypothetical protein
MGYRERMDMDINLGSIKIPINAATKTFAILARRGATPSGGERALRFAIP